MDQDDKKKSTSEESENSSEFTTDIEKELAKQVDDDSFESISLDLSFDDEKKEQDRQSDELWDPTSELDDVSLFDEFATEIAEIEKAEKDKSEKKSSSKDSEELSSLLEAEDEHPEPDFSLLQQEETVQTPEYEEKSFMPWIISGIAFLFLIAGLFTMWKLISIPQPAKSPIITQSKTQTEQHADKESAKTPQHEIKQETKTSEHIEEIPVSEKKELSDNLPHFETISLSSFMIPATQNGQLVFFNIQISLMVADQHIKKEFIKRETRIRDTIYRELKGSDLSHGVNDNTLIMFRKPLLDKINEEYAPLKVEDIKLTGYILK